MVSKGLSALDFPYVSLLDEWKNLGNLQLEKTEMHGDAGG